MRTLPYLAALVFAGTSMPAAHAQTYTWTGTTSAWNNSANWSPSGIPNVAGESALLGNTLGSLAPSLSSSVVIDRLTFAGPAYTITGTPGVTMTVPSIVRDTSAGFNGYVQTIDLPAVAGGSLRFTGTGLDNLVIENGNSGSTAPTLVIGPSTSIGSTTGAGGLRVTGYGHTRISGNIVTNISVLEKSGPGELSLTGTTTTTGNTAVYGGRLTLDYTGNLTSKLPTGSLTLRGSELRVVGNTGFGESVGATTIQAGHSSLRMTGSAGGTLDLNAISLSASTATADFSRASGGSFLTTTPNLNGILGAWATSDSGSSWATNSGGAIVPLAAFGANGNIDVTSSGSLASGFTHNSLRFNSFSGSFSLSGTNALISGGILMTPSSGSVALGGSGSLVTTGNTLYVHQHSAAGDLTIGLDIGSPNLLKTGNGRLILSGFNSNLTGTITVNQGSLLFTSTSSINFASALVFNPNPDSAATTLGYLATGTNPTVSRDILLNGFLGSNVALHLRNFGSGQITYSGDISSTGSLDHTVVISHDDAVNGRTVLSGANTFNGDVALNSGTLGIQSNASLGNAANRLTLRSGFDSGGLEFLINGTTLSRPVTVDGARIIVNGANVATITGQLSGGGTLYKEGTGTLVLTNSANSHGANIFVNAGTLSVANEGSLGAAFNDLVIGAGATFTNTNSFVMGSGHLVALGAAGDSAPATIDVPGNLALTIQGVVASQFQVNPSPLLKTGTGTLVLTGTNTYAGGTTIQSGAIQAASDAALGAAGTPVRVDTLGALTFTGSTTTGRTFHLNSSTLSTNSGTTLTFNNATVAGGFLAGPGSFATAAGSANVFVGTTTTTSASLTLNGTDSLTNFTNGGQLTNAAGRTSTLTRFTNTSSGRLAVNGTANVSDFVSNGLITAAPGATISNTGSDVYLGGGSLTYLGAPGTVPRTRLDLGGRNLVLTAGYLDNRGGDLASGGGIRNGTVIIDYRGLLTGTGYVEDYITQNGGVFSPGNSPGTTPVGTARIQPGGTLNIDIDAAGPNGTPPLGSAGTMPGWSLVQVNTALRIYATPGAKQSITLTSQALGGLNISDEVFNFDPSRSHVWEIIRMQPGAQLFDVAAGGTPINPATFVYDPSIVDVLTAGTFLNDLNGGVFSTAFGPNSIGTHSVYVTFTPVPEPAGILAAALGAWLIYWWRQRAVNQTEIASGIRQPSY